MTPGAEEIEARREQLASYYRDVFEVDVRGKAILADLERRFVKIPDPNDFSQEGMLRVFVRTHQREVVEYVMRQINRANGAVYSQTIDLEDDHE